MGRFRAELERTIETQAKRITELELKLAEALGALDVLRGKGIPGGLTIRGTYNAGVTYIYGDVVMHGGSSWVVTRDRPGDCPGNGWQLLAGVGKRGLRGERGPAGAPGMSAAAAPNPAYWRVDEKRYTATLIHVDGTVSPPLELRSLFAQFLAEVNGS